ncbi:MAG: lipase, partial [Propionibacteriales bacterium]|nr:lipase [Propionibacteriales bacterium]
PVDPVAQDRLGPVLLVPGYGGSETGVDVLAAALRRVGRDVMVVSLAGDGRGDLRLQAQLLDTAVDAALERTGSSSVDVVGYSAGGVITRLWVRDGGGASVARRVVTLGSPHHGTDLAGLATDLTPATCPAACVQLATDSDLLRGLNAKDETPEGPLWVSIWTTDDQVVRPPASAQLSGALNFSVQSVCSGLVVQHGDLPREPAVIAMMLRELGTARPTLPSEADCVPVSR